MSGGLESGLGPEQIPVGGIGAAGQLGGGGGGGGGGMNLGGLMKMFQILQQEGGVQTVAEQAAERGVAPDLSQLPGGGKGGGFGDLQSLTQPQAQPSRDIGAVLTGGGTPAGGGRFGDTAAQPAAPPDIAGASLGGEKETPPDVAEAAKTLGLTPQQAQVLSQLSARPAPQIPRPLTPPRRAGTVAAAPQFGANQLAQPPLSLAQILGRV